MPALALSELLGMPVYDSSGGKVGRVREIAMVPQEDTAHIAAFVIKTNVGDRLLSTRQVKSVNGGVRSLGAVSELTPYSSSEGMLLLDRDLLDQQIIDVNGRKVVRVNDAELQQDSTPEGAVSLKVAFVDVGARGAVRRLLKGVVPHAALRPMLEKIPGRLIPWEFVNLIETDPARRVRLKISSDRLAKLHPADIADIIEELAPAERDAVFQTLDEEVAAQALEEIDPKTQVSIVNSLDSDRAADIVEEMDPDAAADLLGDLPPDRSEQILDEMEPETAEEIEELLEFAENTAAGLMTTDYLALSPTATVHEAIARIREFEGGLETMSTIFLVQDDEKLVGAVPLAQLVLAAPDAGLHTVRSEQLITCSPHMNDSGVAEIFDKYNLLILPVIDEHGVMAGVITADDVIRILRAKF